VFYHLSHTSTLLLWLFWEIVYHFLPRPTILLFYASCHSWDDKRRALHPAFFQKVESSKHFCLGCSGTTILLICPHVPCNSRHLPMCPAIGSDGGLTFCLNYPPIVILPMSASQVPRITSVSHQYSAQSCHFQENGWNWRSSR
jgi:hypothetical protein